MGSAVENVYGFLGMELWKFQALNEKGEEFLKLSSVDAKTEISPWVSYLVFAAVQNKLDELKALSCFVAFKKSPLNLFI